MAFFFGFAIFFEKNFSTLSLSLSRARTLAFKAAGWA
jgi:hypothetical protein